MSSINFPNSPTLNEIHTQNGKSWSWNGTSWLSTVNNTFSLAPEGQLNSLGVGTTPSEVMGEIRATNNITAYFSDERLKNILGVIPNAVDKVKSLNGFYFEPNETAQQLGYEKKVDVGVSAQEVMAILPEIVTEAPIDSEYLTVYYHKLVPLLIEAIKEQQREIDILKIKIS